MAIRLFGLGLLATLLCACDHNLYFSDDEGAPRPTGSLGAHPDELSLPYALGTQVNISVAGQDPGMALPWQVVSDTPAVFRVDQVAPDKDHKVLVASCTATGTGLAHLLLLDQGGQQQRSAEVSVVAPDRAIVLAHGPLRIFGRQSSSFSLAQVGEARVLAGGTGVFAVAYYQGATRVYGRGILRSDAPAGLLATDQTTTGVATNEWLFITPQDPGAWTLHLSVGGAPVAVLPVTAVAEDEIATLVPREEMTPKTDDNQQIWVLAQARDAQGRDIYGAYGTWTLSGTPQSGDNDPSRQFGDLYRYKYDPHGTPQPLVATMSGHTAMLNIQAHSGFVSDTTYLGCGAGRGRGTGGASGTLVALGLLGVVLLRRR